MAGSPVENMMDKKNSIKFGSVERPDSATEAKSGVSIPDIHAGPAIGAVIASALKEFIRSIDTVDTEVAKAARAAATKLLNRYRPSVPISVYVVVDGAAIAVFDTHGLPIKEVHIVDYDLASEGQCPVCRDELDDHDHCQVCGYDHMDGNGLTAAIQHWREQDQKI